MPVFKCARDTCTWQHVRDPISLSTSLKHLAVRDTVVRSLDDDGDDYDERKSGVACVHAMGTTAAFHVAVAADEAALPCSFLSGTVALGTHDGPANTGPQRAHSISSAQWGALPHMACLLVRQPPGVQCISNMGWSCFELPCRCFFAHSCIGSACGIMKAWSYSHLHR